MLGQKNNRQFIRMREQLDTLSGNNNLIRHVAANMAFLRDAIDGIDENWEREFNEEVLNLESLSCATEEQIKIMGPKHADILKQSTDKLYNLISKALNNE